jgi:hypothetical protein
MFRFVLYEVGQNPVRFLVSVSFFRHRRKENLQLVGVVIARIIIINTNINTVLGINNRNTLSEKRVT